MAEEGPVVFTRRASGLVREVGAFTAMSIGLTHTIGGGINKLMVLMRYENPGASEFGAFGIAGLIVILTAVAYTMLAVSMPRTGGDYIYISRAIHPVLGFLTSWAFYFTEILSLGVIAYYDTDYWALGFNIYGSATENATMYDWSDTLTNNDSVRLAVALSIVVVAALVTYLGTRVYSYIINIGLFLGVIGSIVMGVYFLAHLSGDTAQLWNETYGPGTYEAIHTKAVDLGVETASFSVGATIDASIAAVWAYIGFTAAAYMGGEVKNPSRSLIWAMVGGSIVIIAYYLFLSLMVANTFGDFMADYAYMYFDQKETLLEIMPHAPAAILPTYACALAPGQTVLQLIMALSAAIWLLNDIPAFFLVCSRLVFSWSFDRFFPEKLADVNDRFHSPHYAILLTAIGGFVGVLLCAAGEYQAAMETTVGFLFAITFGTAAAAITPYVRKDLYERSIKLEVAGVPVMTIFGLLAFGCNFFLLFVAGSGLWTGDSGLLNLGLVAIWEFIGLLIFVAYYKHNIDRGVDVDTIYAEIPPA
ncbi:MAG: APC family permease [Euryarchaeota archaeon]|nr:APC family permease [Euryarchaeota archaeon]